MHEIFVAYLREWHVGLKSPRKTLQHLLQPLMYLLFFAPTMAASLRTMDWQGSEVPYLNYIVPGLIAVTALSIGNGVGISVFIDRITGELETLFELPIRRQAILIGLAGNALVRSVLVGTLLLMALPLMTNSISVSLNTCFYVITALSVSSVAWTLLSVTISCSVKSQETYNLVINLIQLPLMLSSSVFYSLTNGPPIVRMLARINPLSFSAESLRSIMISQRFWSSGLIGMLAFLLLVIITSAYAIDRAVE